jgi:hypothetical protein
VIGILLGIVVMVLVDHSVWPVRAHEAMYPTLTSALRSLAGLCRVPPAEAGYAASLDRALRVRSAVYRDLSAVLRLREEARMEPGAGTRAAHDERERVLRLTGHVQEVFLALLVVVRHRLALDPRELPAMAAEAMAGLDAAIGAALDAAADQVAGAAAVPLPDLRAGLARVENTVTGSPPESPGRGDDPAWRANVAVQLAAYREAVGTIERLGEEAAAPAFR